MDGGDLFRVIVFYWTILFYVVSAAGIKIIFVEDVSVFI